MMVLDFVHQNVMKLVIPEVNYDGIAIVDYLSHSLDFLYSVIVLECPNVT